MEPTGESETMLEQMFLKVCDSLRTYDLQMNENFKCLNTNFDRFRFIWTPSAVHSDIDRLLEKKHYDPKDSSKSQQCRYQGNDEFKKHNFRDALILYTQSIRFAYNPKLKTAKDEQKTGDELALAYANRSAAFYQLEQFELSLNDIESSFKYGYPEKSGEKLIERKLHCLYKLGRFGDILEYIKGAAKTLDLNIFQIYEKKMLEELNAKLTEQSAKNKKKSFEMSLDGKLGDLKFEIPEEEKSKKLDHSTNKIQIDYAVNEGFHFKASEDLKVGELIIDEPPYASVLIAEHIKQNCFECMKPIDPYKMNTCYCRQCSLVTYCCKLN